MIAERNCPICGTPFRLNNPHQLYCSRECRKVAILDNQRKRNARISAEKRAAKRKKPSNTDEINQINEMALSSGMSYGQYVALHKI